jgi:nucleoside-diphosphate-sugar epimerase
MRVAVTGGAGYLGALVVKELLARGQDVTVLDSLIHGQVEVADRLALEGARIVEGDVRDPGARAEALTGATSVVHLGAIVGDPACARDPELAESVNIEGTRALVTDARARGTERFLFASTCSNYGRMSDPTVPVDETGDLAPVSLYAEQKVGIERWLLGGDHGTLAPTCLRFATLYGAAPRMRFDLTVNEFTRDLWAGRQLEVFGERFWRPYVHVADAARVVCSVLEADRESVRGQVFNVGRSDENYRKLDLVEMITTRLGRGEVSYVHRAEDPRDYKVGFEKLVDRLGLRPRSRVPEGIDEIITRLEQGRFGDPFHPRHSNLTSGRVAEATPVS